MELTLNFALLWAMCSCCPPIGNLLETEEEFKSIELSQMIGHKAHEAAMFKKLILFKHLKSEKNYARMLQLMTSWNCVSLHNVKTCKTIFVTTKENPT